MKRNILVKSATGKEVQTKIANGKSICEESMVTGTWRIREVS